MLTMPPNQPVVSRINRFVMFSKETAPTQQGLAADLVKKYGPPSFDAGPGTLTSLGSREMIWADDAQGNRLKNQVADNGNPSPLLYHCRNLTTFRSDKLGGARVPSGVDVQPDPIFVKLRIEQGYAHQTESQAAGMCGGYTIITARLFYANPLGVSAPDVVGGLLVSIGNNPLDRSATDATHHYLIQAAKAREVKEKEGAQKNRPAL